MNGLVSNFATSSRIQLRVIYALVMREIITRYGRHNIGFAWMFAEPMIFTLGVMVIWSYAESSRFQHHMSVASFAITGYSTILMWRNVIGRCVEAVEPNKSLLFHRNVTILDVFISRIALEVGGVTTATIMIFAIFIAAGTIPVPDDLLKMFCAWFLLCWYSAAMGLLIGSLSEFSELVEKIWHPIAYFQLPLSGAMVMTASLPAPIRQLILIFPVPNCVELFRSGYYGGLIKTMYDIPYVIEVLMCLTLAGLYFTRLASKRVS